MRNRKMARRRSGVIQSRWWTAAIGALSLVGFLQAPSGHAEKTESVTASGLISGTLQNGRLRLEIPKTALNRELLLVGRITSGTTDPQFPNVPGLGPNHGPIPWSPFVETVLELAIEETNSLLVTKQEGPGSTSAKKGEEQGILARVPIVGRTASGGCLLDGEKLLQNSKLGFHGQWALNPDAVRFTRWAGLTNRAEIQGELAGKEGPIGVQWSLMTLPEPGMRSRQADARVNFSMQGSNIERWRLVRKNSAGGLSEPEHPILVYIDASVPPRWLEQVQEGVLEWNRAFEAAGFTNALKVERGPTEDPNWSAFDLRQGITIWWSTNGLGGNCWKRSDPRTGELLNAVVTLFADDMWDTRNEYFLRAGGVDTNANTWPVPDRILNHAVRRLAAHEAGHALGFEHNFMSVFPVTKLRDPLWTAEEGSSPTVMGYNAYNRVAQACDRVPVDSGLLPRVGRFDLFAAHWGYAEIPSAATTEEERLILDKWTAQAQETSWLRYSRQEGTFGDLDPWKHLPKSDADWLSWAEEHLKRTRLYMANERYVFAGLTNWTNAGVAGDGLILFAMKLWCDALESVAHIVGSPVPREMQSEAVRLLADEAFSLPAHLDNPGLLQRWGDETVRRNLRFSESVLLTAVLQGTLTNRLKMSDGALRYSVRDLLAELRPVFWRELKEPVVVVTPRRQMIQKLYLGYLRGLAGRVGQPLPTREGLAPLPEHLSNEALDIFRGEIARLSEAVRSARVKAGDEATRAYLKEIAGELAAF